MRSRAVTFTARLVRVWTRVYTLGTPFAVRDARLSEIECDLWECQHDAERRTYAAEILIRLLLGIPHDLMWRFEQTTGDASMPGVGAFPRTVTVSAFTCSFTLHVIALACVVWWAAWPADRAPSHVSASRAPAPAGPALLSAAPLAIPESDSSATMVPSGKDDAMKKTARAIVTMFSVLGLPIAAQQSATGPAFEAASV